MCYSGSSFPANSFHRATRGLMRRHWVSHSLFFISFIPVSLLGQGKGTEVAISSVLLIADEGVLWVCSWAEVSVKLYCTLCLIGEDKYAILVFLHLWKILYPFLLQDTAVVMWLFAFTAFIPSTIFIHSFWHRSNYSCLYHFRVNSAAKTLSISA